MATYWNKDELQQARTDTVLSSLDDMVSGFKSRWSTPQPAVEPQAEQEPSFSFTNLLPSLTPWSQPEQAPDATNDVAMRQPVSQPSSGTGSLLDLLPDLTPWMPKPDPASRAATTPSASEVAPARPTAASGTPAPMPSGQPSPGAQQQPTSTAATGKIDNSSRQAFVRTAWPYMLEAADGDAGMAETLMAIAISENGDIGAGGDFVGNNFAGVKGRGSAGSVESSTWEEVNGQRVPTRAMFAAYNTPQEGFRAFGQFLRDNPRYHPALASYQKTGDADQLLRDVNEAGYATDSNWASTVSNIRRNQVTPIVASAQARPQAPAGQPAPMPQASSEDLTPDQSALDDPDKWSLCGPVAAVAMARSRGGNWTVAQAKQYAASNGLWNADQGMGGLEAEAKLLRGMGYAAKTSAPDWDAITRDVATGNPVSLSTTFVDGGHYVVLEKYDEKTGKFKVGGLGNVLKKTTGRGQWYTAAELQELGGIQGALHFDSPASPTPSVAVSDPNAAPVSPTPIAAASQPEPAPSQAGSGTPALAAIGVGEPRTQAQMAMPVGPVADERPYDPDAPDQPRETGYTVPPDPNDPRTADEGPREWRPASGAGAAQSSPIQIPTTTPSVGGTGLSTPPSAVASSPARRPVTTATLPTPSDDPGGAQVAAQDSMSTPPLQDDRWRDEGPRELPRQPRPASIIPEAPGRETITRGIDAAIDTAGQVGRALPGTTLGSALTGIPTVRDFGSMLREMPAERQDRMYQIQEAAARDQGLDTRNPIALVRAPQDAGWRSRNPDLAAEYDSILAEEGLDVVGQTGDAARVAGRAGQALQRQARGAQGAARGGSDLPPITQPAARAAETAPAPRPGVQQLGSGFSPFTPNPLDANQALRGRIVPPDVADDLDFPLRIPEDPSVIRAIEAAGGTIDERGVTMHVIRNQDPEAAGGVATRGMPFYVAGPPGAPNPYAKTQKAGVAGVGGPDRIEGWTRFRSPLIIRGAPGDADGFDDAMELLDVGSTKAMREAQVEYQRIDGLLYEIKSGKRPPISAEEEARLIAQRDAAKERLRVGFEAGGPPNAYTVEQEIDAAKRAGSAGSPERAQALKDLVTRYGGDPDLIDDLMALRGADMGESVYAVKENIVSGNARRQGYDGVVTVQNIGVDESAVSNHPKVMAAAQASDAAQATYRQALAARDRVRNTPAAINAAEDAIARAEEAIEQTEAAYVATLREVREELGSHRITELADVREAANPTPGAVIRTTTRTVDEIDAEMDGLHPLIDSGRIDEAEFSRRWHTLMDERNEAGGFVTRTEAPGYTLRSDIPRRPREAGSGVVAARPSSALRGALPTLHNAAQGGVLGAASEDLEAMQEGREADPHERMRRAAGGAVLGVGAGRLARGGGQALGSGFVNSPNYRPPAPQQVQRAAAQGARRGQRLNRAVTAPGSDVPPLVRAATASTDDRAGLRWAEDMLSDTAGNPRMRENDPRRPSTQSRVNTGSVANHRIETDLEPAIVNAGRAGLQDELPQHLEDMQAKDILDEFYNRGHQAVVDRRQPAIDAAKARGANPAVIQRMEAKRDVDADKAGIKKMRTRQGSDPDMTYEAIEARLQAQEAKLKADGRWTQLQDSATAIWTHNDDTLTRLEQAGEVDAADVAYWRQAYPHYVPTVPVSHLDARGGGPVANATGPRVSRGTQKSVHALEDVGTSGDRLNPIAATRNATVRAERQMQRNKVAAAFAEMMDDALQASPGTMGTNAATHRTFLGGGTDVIYMANGKPVTMSVPKAVADGIEAAANMSADPGTVGRIWKRVMGVVTSAMTAGRASFLPVNLSRDAGDYAIRTASREGGPGALPKVMGTWLDEAGKAAADIMRAQVTGRGIAGAATGAASGAAIGDEDTTLGDRVKHGVEGAIAGTFLLGANRVRPTGKAREYLARGGGSGGVSAHWKAGERWLRDVQRDGGAPIRTPADAAHYLGDWLADVATLQGVKGINERTELISRTAAMRRADAQGLPPTEAMTRGRDASYDPDRAGTVARTINGIVPFFNASVQNAAQTTRLFKQNPVAATAAITATVAPVMALAEAWNRSDPDRAQTYDDIPQYIKDTGLVVVIGGSGSDNRGERPRYIWIPTGLTTPFVIGMRKAMENVPGLEPTAGRGEEGWADLLGTMIQTFNPLKGDSFGAAASNLIPQGVKQIAELSQNKDFFRGNPIATDNADERASAFSRKVAEGANAVGRFVGNDALQNLHPSQVEHVSRALPAYHDIVSGASDMIAPSGYKRAEDRPVANEPFLGGIASRFVRDQGGAGLQRAQEGMLPESVRPILQEAGMRPEDIKPVGSTWKSGPLTRGEAEAWQAETNGAMEEMLSRAMTSGKWNDPAARETLIREAITKARNEGARRAGLPSDSEMQQRIRDDQAMKAS